MKKLIALLGLFVILISINSAFSWYFPNEPYRRAITISNSGSQIANMQVQIPLTFTTNESNYGDLRFTWVNQSNGAEVQIPYWIENDSFTNNTPVVWIKVPILYSGNTTVYAYYGNSSLPSQSNGSAVFIFFDNFETWSGWTTYGLGGVSQSSNYHVDGLYSAYKSANGDPNGVVKQLPSTLSRSTPFVVEAYVLRPYTTGYDWDRFGVVDPYGNGYGFGAKLNSYYVSVDLRQSYSATANYAIYSTYVPLGSWYKGELILTTTSAISRILNSNDVPVASYTYASTLYDNFTQVYIFGGYPFYVDDLRIREYSSVAPEGNFPTTIGQEQTPLPSNVLVDSNNNTISVINYTPLLYGYSDVNPNVYLRVCGVSPGENVSLVYHGVNQTITISNTYTLTQNDVSNGCALIDLDIYPFEALYPGKIFAYVNGTFINLYAENLGYFVTKTTVSNNALNVTVFSYDNNWSNIDSNLASSGIIPSKPKIIFDLYYPNGTLYYESMIYSNKTFSIPLPPNFNRSTYKFYYNGIWSDTVPPVIDMVYPINSHYYYDNITTINVTITDDSKVTLAIINVDGTNYTLTNSQGNNYYVNVNIGEGHHKVIVYARDIYNNSANRTFYFDVFESPIVNVSAEHYTANPILNVSVYNTNDTGILIPLNTNKSVPVTNYSNSTWVYYTIDTKSLIDAGVLNSNCSNIEVLTYNHIQVPFKIENCNSYNSKLYVPVNVPLYMKVVNFTVNQFRLTKDYVAVSSILYPNNMLADPYHTGLTVSGSIGGSKNYILVYNVDTRSRLLSPMEIYSVEDGKYNLVGTISMCGGTHYLPAVSSTTTYSLRGINYLIETSNGLYVIFPLSRSDSIDSVSGLPNDFTIYISKITGNNSVAYPTAIHFPDYGTGNTVSKNVFLAAGNGNEFLINLVEVAGDVYGGLYLVDSHGNTITKINDYNVFAVTNTTDGFYALSTFNGYLRIYRIYLNGTYTVKDTTLQITTPVYGNFISDGNNLFFLVHQVAKLIVVDFNLNTLSVEKQYTIPLLLTGGTYGTSLAKFNDSLYLVIVSGGEVPTIYTMEINLTDNTIAVAQPLDYSGQTLNSPYYSVQEFTPAVVFHPTYSLVIGSYGLINSTYQPIINNKTISYKQITLLYPNNNLKQVWYTAMNLETGNTTTVYLGNANTYSVPLNLSDGTYSIKVSAENIYGDISSAYKTIVIDKTPPTFTYSIEKKGDLVNVTYSVNDKNIDKCWYSLNGGANVTIPCSGTLDFSYPELHTGINNLTIYAIDKAGNFNKTQISIDVNCVILRSINGSFSLNSDLSICKGTYNVNYNITLNGHTLDLNGSTLIGTTYNYNTTYSDVLFARYTNKALNTISIFGSGKVINGVLKGFDVSIVNANASDIVIENSNIGYICDNGAVGTNIEFINDFVPTDCLVYNSTVNNLPIVIANGTINPSTVGTQTVGGIILNGDADISNLTIEYGGIWTIGTPSSINLTDSNISNAGLISLKASNLKVEGNRIINTHGANIFTAETSGQIYNNYFHNIYTEDISPFSFDVYTPDETTYTSTIVLYQPENCSEKSIIGGCMGGNYWTNYTGSYNSTTLIGESPKIVPMYFVDNGNEVFLPYNLIDPYPLANSTSNAKVISSNYTSTFGTTSNFANFKVNGFERRAILKEKVELKLDSPPIISGDYAYWVGSKLIGDTYVPQLVKYDLANHKVVWTRILPTGIMSNDEVYSNISSSYYNRNYKIIANSKYVCVTPPGTMIAPTVTCYDVNTGSEVVSVTPSKVPSIDSPMPSGTSQITFTLNNDTLIYLYDYATEVHSPFDYTNNVYYYNLTDNYYLCSLDLKTMKQSCTSFSVKSDERTIGGFIGNYMAPVPPIKPEVVYDPNLSVIYVIARSNYTNFNGSAIYGFDANTLQKVYQLNLDPNLVLTTQPVIYKDTLYFGGESDGVYYLYAFSNGFLREIQLVNVPNYINVYGNELIISTGKLYSPAPSKLYLISTDLNITTAKSIDLPGTALMTTVTKDTLYVPYVVNKMIGACGSFNEYELGVLALNLTTWSPIWNYTIDYSAQLGEMPAPFVAIPNGTELFVPIIHYYVNESSGAMTPMIGKMSLVRSGFMLPTPGWTLLVLTQAPQTCADIANSDGLHCDFNLSAPNYGYVDPTGTGICYAGDCHPTCDPSLNDPFGRNSYCASVTSYNWIYCCGSDSLYQICIRDTRECPIAQNCGDLYQACCQPGNTCNLGLHCGCSATNTTPVCLPNGEGFSFYTNSLWGNWNSFLNGNQACCSSGWENVVIS